MARDQRRLSAIVSADVAGYSSLMGQDESRTLAALKAHRRELFDPKIAEYSGRIVKTTGDGLLLDFSSVVDAVRCAVDVQRGMVVRNAEVPAHEKIEFRIGINVGDIIIDSDDIFGDGVNVAARLQALAEPGGICVSKVVRDQVLDKLSFAFEELGSQQLKNIARPIEVYRILDEAPHPGHDGTAPAPAKRTSPADSGPLSIAVLPFINLTGDASQDYFAEGLTVTLTADVSQIEDAVVIDSVTAQSFKGKTLTTRQVGNALGVRFVLQGNVQRSGHRIRVSAQLADALTNTQLWSDTFDGDDTDQFALQDRITAKIAASLHRELMNVAARKSELQRGDPTVIDLLLRARAQSLKPRSLENWQQVERLYRQALAIQPGHTKATMELASVLAFEANNFETLISSDGRDRALREAIDLATQAHAADPGNPEYFRIVAIHARAYGDLAGERRAAEELVRLRPKWAYPYNILGHSYMMAGDFDKAIELLTQAVNLTPTLQDGLPFAFSLGNAYFGAGNNKAAIDWCGKVVTIQPTLGAAHYLMAMAYALDGNLASAHAEADEVRRLMPDFKFEADKLRAEAKTPARKAYIEGKVIPALEKAGLLE
jgi:class 3 adenylate cyclase/TolB-like protein/Flp pilus assembly protein TadD